MPLPLIRKPSRFIKARSGERGVNTDDTDFTMTDQPSKPRPVLTTIDENPFAWFLTPPSTPPASIASSGSTSPTSSEEDFLDDDDDDDVEAFIFEGNAPAGIAPPEKHYKANHLPPPKLLTRSPRSRSLSPLRQFLVRRWLRSHQQEEQLPSPASSPSGQAQTLPRPISPVIKPTRFLPQPIHQSRGRDRERDTTRDGGMRHREPDIRPRRQGSSASLRPRVRPHSWREPSSELWTVLEEGIVGSHGLALSHEAVSAPRSPIGSRRGGAEMGIDSFPPFASGALKDANEDEDADIDEEMILDAVDYQIGR
ncbi:MAG: hypothetical protein M4579_000009 [Chaenotheca gracillima]|nr:MAG: hypothetical protein M4579_000009 [Chaenotheca gracillima]